MNCELNCPSLWGINDVYKAEISLRVSNRVVILTVKFQSNAAWNFEMSFPRGSPKKFWVTKGVTQVFRGEDTPGNFHDVGIRFEDPLGFSDFGELLDTFAAAGVMDSQAVMQARA